MYYQIELKFWKICCVWWNQLIIIITGVPHILL